MDYAQKHALKQADPKYQAFSTRIEDAWEEKRKINTKQCIAMRQICQLEYALDLIRSKSWEFKCTEESTDKMLYDSTGKDGKGWSWTFQNGAEEIEKLMIQKCIKVANHAAQWDALTERIRVLNKDQDKYGEKLVKEAGAKK